MKTACAAFVQVQIQSVGPLLKVNSVHLEYTLRRGQVSISHLRIWLDCCNCLLNWPAKEFDSDRGGVASLDS